MPALLVRRGADRILFDCGEGTQRQLVATVGLADLSDIFLTHYHADHWLGLPGLLKTFDLRAREKPLRIHGPRGLQELVALVVRAVGRVRFDLEVKELDPGQQVARDGYRVAPFSVAHRGASLGYVLFEDERPGAFDPDAAVRLGLVPGPEHAGRDGHHERVVGAEDLLEVGPDGAVRCRHGTVPPLGSSARGHPPRGGDRRLSTVRYDVHIPTAPPVPQM